MELKEHYDQLWKQSLQKFRRQEFEFDHMIDSADDTRYGLTLLARPSEEVKQSVLETLEEIKTVAPNQYYYPNSDLHVTVLPIISCYSGFSLDSIKSTEYHDIIDNAVDSIPPFHITFSGLTASPSCILIQGFPVDNQLNKLRNNLREEFKQSDLQHSIDERYKLQTTHMTAIRFKKPFSETERFITMISRLRDKKFGRCVIDRLELVGNDWYQRKDKVKFIDKFELTAIQKEVS